MPEVTSPFGYFFFPQVFPERIDGFNQRFFLFPAAGFYSFLFGYGFCDGGKGSVIHQFLCVVFSRKRRRVRFRDMLLYTFYEVGGNAGIKNRVVLIGQDINAATSLHRIELVFRTLIMNRNEAVAHLTSM